MMSVVHLRMTLRCTTGTTDVLDVTDVMDTLDVMDTTAFENFVNLNMVDTGTLWTKTF